MSRQSIRSLIEEKDRTEQSALAAEAVVALLQSHIGSRSGDAYADTIQDFLVTAVRRAREYRETVDAIEQRLAARYV